MTIADRTSVIVCRGCCCGSATKHPEVDHAAQVAALTAAVPNGGRLWEVDCLGPCERSNVVVVRTRSAGRRWFGDVLDPADSQALAAWIAGGAPDRPPPRVAALSFDPDQPTGPALEPVDATAEQLASEVHRWVRRGDGGWSIGVQGAVAELPPVHDDTPRWVSRSGRTITDRRVLGGLRLTISDQTVAFLRRKPERPEEIADVILAIPRTPASGPLGLTVVGDDHEALAEDHRQHRLIDLGLGLDAARFLVRTDAADLLAILEHLRSQPLREVLAQAGPALLAHAPNRVVASALGRIEVATPIPPPDGTSPEGPHTHLLPDRLEQGRELPVGTTLRSDLVPAATFHPPPGWVWG